MKRHVCKACGEIFPSAEEHVLHLLTRRTERGIGSTEIRTRGISGNPSERIRELRDRGISIVATRRRHPQGHIESLYVLEAFAPKANGTLVMHGKAFNWADHNILRQWADALDHEEALRANERQAA